MSKIGTINIGTINKERGPGRRVSSLFILSGVLFVLVLASYLSLFEGGVLNLSGLENEMREIIFWKIRLPRLLASFVVGASLGLSGFIFQNVLKNPLADPYILGISSGATLGTAVYILFTTAISSFGISISAYGGGLFALLMLVLMYKVLPYRPLVLILYGIAISFFFSSITTFIISGMEGNKLVLVSSWLMGNIGQPEVKDLLIPMIILGSGFMLFFVFAPIVDALQYGEEFASASGVNVFIFPILFISIASILTASVVSICGTVAFVGLVVPHITRLLFHCSARKALFLLVIIGSAFMACCNAVAGTFSRFGSEVPIGAVTSAVGAVVLVFLLFKSVNRHG